MTRVMVIGNAGGGKSVLSRAIAEAHGLPYVELDRLLWAPGWVQRSSAEFCTLHAEILATNAWVIDCGGPWASVEARLAASDTVVFVDLPIARHLWWAARRQVVSLFVGRPDGPDGCPMWPVTIRLFRMMIWMERSFLPRLRGLLAVEIPDRRLIHIRSVRQLRAFLADPS
jgi:adenylate kinase family enzyme